MNNMDKAQGKRIIKLDVDGVLRDIVSPMCRIYNNEFGGNIKASDLKDYGVDSYFENIPIETGLKPSEYFFKIRAKDVFLDLAKPYRGVKKALDIMRDAGNEIIIVTWQFNIDNVKHTLDFLDSYGIKYDHIAFTDKKYLINGDVLVDDCPKFLCDTRDTSHKIRMTRSYNNDCCKTLDGREISSASSLVDAANIITELFAN